MASQAAQPVGPSPLEPGFEPVQSLPDLQHFATQLKSRLAHDDGTSLDDQIDAFVGSHGAALHAILAARQQDTGDRHLVDLYRQGYLAARGSIPLDPISQAPGGICELPGNLALAPLALRAAALIHGLACQWLEHRARCDRIVDRPFDCPTLECTSFGLFRRIDAPIDSLERKPDAAHVAVVYRDHVGFVRLSESRGGAIAPSLEACLRRWRDWSRRPSWTVGSIATWPTWRHLPASWRSKCLCSVIPGFASGFDTPRSPPPSCVPSAP